MERQEPKIGNGPNMDGIEFRPRSYRGTTQKSAQDDTGNWIKAGIAFIVIVIVAMGLIEWNARRQAAALTTELMRPMTPKEEAQLKAQMKKWERETEAETAAQMTEISRKLQESMPHIYRPSPLQPGQRCMQGRRFERVENGWKQVMEPC